MIFLKRMGKEVLLPLVISRLGLALIGWLAIFSLHPVARSGQWEIGPAGKVQPIQGEISTRNYPFLNMWSRWDAGWYQDLAQNGYHFAAGQPSNTAFFPMYPLAMRAVRIFLHSHKANSWLLAGVIVSNVTLAIAASYLWLLTRLEFDQATARRAVLYLLVFPMTLFLSAVYAESIFLAFALAAFYHARRGQWWLAGLLGACCALCRPPGMMIGFALAAEYAMQCEFSWRKLRPNLLALALVPLALGSFLAYLHFKQGSAGVVLEAQEAWGLRGQSQWKTLAPFLHQGLQLRGTLIDLAFVFAFTALLVAVAFRMRGSYAVYSAAYLFFITMWGSFESVSRYGLGLFPAIMLLASFGKNPTFDRIYLPLSAALAALFMAVFALWGWVA